MLNSARTTHETLPHLGILADDLTGACDAAAAFAGRGAHAVVSLRAGAHRAATVHVLCTATRELAPKAAAAAIAAAAPGVAACTHVFKKIDSAFRGNTFVEIAASVQAFPHRFAVLAPAFPAQGRTCIESTLYHSDLSGTRTLPLRRDLHAAGTHPVWLPASSRPEPLHTAMRDALIAGVPAVFCHAATDADLVATVAAARALQYPILWVGSAGLAHALAGNMYLTASTPATLPAGPVLFLIGSTHPVTAQQCESLADVPGAYLVPILRGVTTEADISCALAAFRPRQVGCLVMTGGDTALQACHALGIEALEVIGEFAPGIPVARARGGSWDGVTVLLKSGGFGESSLFHQIAGLHDKDLSA